MRLSEKLSVSPKNDSYIQSFCFDYFGGCLAGISSTSLLEIYDHRADQLSMLKVESGHLKFKPARVAWLHPDPLIVSTGFYKQSNRILSLWDTRRMDAPKDEYNFGSSFAVLEPLWDSHLPILYLKARNVNLNIMEIAAGSLVSQEWISLHLLFQSFPNQSAILENVKLLFLRLS